MENEFFRGSRFTDAGANPFTMNPDLAAGAHSINVGDYSGSGKPESLLLGKDMPARQESGEDASVREARRKMRDIYALTLGKNALTTCKIEGDAQFEKYKGYTDIQIDGIGREHSRFLEDQKKRYEYLLTNPRTREHFNGYFIPYQEDSLQRAEEIEMRGIEAFRAETARTQNEELLSRALRDENINDASLQASYRDHYIHNVEMLCEGLSPEERDARIIGAGRDFCIPILERHIEVNPGAAVAMLDSRYVQNVLGGEVEAHYRERAARALRDDELYHAAGELATSDLPSEAALDQIRERFPDPREFGKAKEEYDMQRYSHNMAKTNQSTAELMQAWRDLEAGDKKSQEKLNRYKRNDPDLYEFLRANYRAIGRQGGNPPKPSYSTLERLTRDFDPYEAAEMLRNRKTLFDVITQLGGPTSSASGAFMRLYTRNASLDDMAWFNDLGVALKTVKGERLPKGEQDDFLSRYTKNRVKYLEENNLKELDDDENREVIEKAALNMGWEVVASGEEVGNMVISASIAGEDKEPIEGQESQPVLEFTDEGAPVDKVGKKQQKNSDAQSSRSGVVKVLNNETGLPEEVQYYIDEKGRVTIITGTNGLEEYGYTATPEEAAALGIPSREGVGTTMQATPVTGSLGGNNPVASYSDGVEPWVPSTISDSVEKFEQNKRILDEGWRKIHDGNKYAPYEQIIDVPTGIPLDLSVNRVYVSRDGVNDDAVEYVDNPFLDSTAQEHLDEYEKAGYGNSGLRGFFNRFRRSEKMPVRRDIGFAESSENGKRVITIGTRALLDPHKRWGKMENIQKPFIVDSLNRFFREQGAKHGLPPDLNVRAHPNGMSLIYEWDNGDDVTMRLFQSARPSFLFDAVSNIGGNFKAQERDWGFVTTNNAFSGSSDKENAVTVFHEFLHQHTQIHKLGVSRYWPNYAYQFFRRGYDNISFEKDLDSATIAFEDFVGVPNEKTR